jgi:hypothetical protein
VGNLSNLDALRYAEAPDWRGLVNAFTKSLSDSTLDEMILLLHSKAQNTKDGYHDTSGPSCMKISKRSQTASARRPPHVAQTHVHRPTLLPGFPTSEGHPIEPENDDGPAEAPCLARRRRTQPEATVNLQSIMAAKRKSPRLLRRSKLPSPSRLHTIAS